MEKIPENTRIMLVGNHRSKFDPIISWFVFRRWKPAFISKAENFSVPVFGRIIRKCCFMAIDRKNPRRALPTVKKAAELLKSGEVSIGVYPEGTRSRDGRLLDFHSSVFKIAQWSQAPVVVVSLLGTEQIARNFPLRATQVYLDVLEVIPPQEISAMKTNAVSDRVYKLLENKINEGSA